MCFVDVFNLEYKDVSGGYIQYLRSKTGVPLCVKVEPEMQLLMDYYREEGSPFVFPSLHRNCYKEKAEVSEPTAIRRINRQLNAIGRLLGFVRPLTSYVGRHTWASFAEASGMSLSFISQGLGLGHGSERVTRTYLKGIPSYKMDAVNKDMLDRMIRGNKNKTEEQEKKERCPILCKSETSYISDKPEMINFKAYLPANVWIIMI